MSADEIGKRSATYRQLQELGGEFITARGWETPFTYQYNERYLDDYSIPKHPSESELVGVEHLHTRDTVGLCSLQITAVIDVRGKSAPNFIQNMLSNDMDMDVGQSRYGTMLNHDGGVLGDLVASRLDTDHYYVYSLGGQSCEDTTQWLREHAPPEVCVHNLDDGYACMGIYGPDALEVVEPLTEANLSRDGLEFFGCKKFEIRGIPVLAVRLSYVGEFGWELWTPSGYESRLWDIIWERTKEVGGTVFGIGALISMGLEKGYHIMGTDLGIDYTPHEAGLGRFVDMDTDFIGKESVDGDIDRKRVGITVNSGSVIPDENDVISVDGDQIGEVSRSGYGYSIEEKVVISYLPIEHTEPGTTVLIESGDDQYEGTVREWPLFDPEDKRMRS